MRHFMQQLSTAALVCLLTACSGAADAGLDETGGINDDSTAAKTVIFSAEQIQHGGIQWAPVSATSVVSRVELPGQLVPNEDRTARLGAPAQGRVITLHVRPGDRVSQGQTLVTLQSEAGSSAAADHAKASAELAARRAAAAYARTARERADRLLAIKAGSRQEAERAAVDDQAAQAAVVQAETEVARAASRMTQLGATSVSGNILVRSPLGGVVLSRDVSPGAVVDAGAPLVTVSDPASLWLEVSAGAGVAAAVRTGTRVQFVVPAFPADTFNATVQSIGGALDSDTRMIPLRARVLNNDGRLRAAMFATTWVASGERRDAVVVPDSAVQLLDNRTVVFIAQPDGSGGARLERRDVEIGETVSGQTQIVSGMRAGDVVVIAGAFAVKSEFARSKMAED